jgi:ComF family protein
MLLLKEMKDSLLHFLFPHTCCGCGSDILPEDSTLCLRCLYALPETGFEWHPSNPAEKMFWGRLPLTSASAGFYFTKESLVQHLMHQLKYKGNKELGIQLGRLMGEALKKSGRFPADALIPLPLFPAKEKRRGYNQATVLCEGISAAMHIPVWDQVVQRPEHTETQTKKGRVERWKNMEGKFIVKDPALLQNKRLLLVDDVVTTGATLESCGAELLKIPGVELSIATLCIAAR